MNTITITSKKRVELIDITSQINNIVQKLKIESGICVVYTPHTTAGITVNENADPDVKKDIIKFINENIPENYGFKHMEGNSDSHIKSSFFGCSQTFIIENSKLLLGTWQSVYFCEFDGPRTRKVIIKIIKEKLL